MSKNNVPAFDLPDFDLDVSQQIKTAQATLTEADLPDGLKHYAGVTVICRTDVTFKYSMKSAKFFLAQANLKADPESGLKAISDYEQVICDTVVAWNLSRGGKRLPISVEGVEQLSDDDFTVVNIAIGKALSDGVLDPNSPKS